jgi:hypothetical protein
MRSEIMRSGRLRRVRGEADEEDGGGEKANEDEAFTVEDRDGVAGGMEEVGDADMET